MGDRCAGPGIEGLMVSWIKRVYESRETMSRVKDVLPSWAGHDMLL